MDEIDCRELEGETCLSRLLTLKCWLSEMSRGAWLHMYAPTGQYKLPSNWSDGDRDALQTKIDHISGGALLVLVFSVFEGHWPEDPSALEQHRSELISERDLDRLLAMRHIRHSIAHRPDGGRAHTHAAVFDQVMEGRTKLLGVKKYGDNRLVLAQSIGFEALRLISNIVDEALNRCPETTQPTSHPSGPE